jgi:hypothetical protein
MFVSMVRPGSIRPIPPLLAVAALAIVALAACGGAGTESADARSASTPGIVAGGGAIGSAVVAGDDLCRLLGPGDLTAAGVSGAGGPTENNQPPDAWFCVYRGESSATGGIELDVFLSDSATAAHDVFPDLFGEYLAANVKTVSIAGADEARMVLPTSDGSTDPALIGARKGRLTIGLGVGTAFADAEKTSEQIRQLSVLVLQRAGTLGN